MMTIHLPKADVQPYYGTEYVLGVDPSLTSTGVAALSQDGRVLYLKHHGRVGHRNETLRQRRDRVHSIVSEVSNLHRATAMVRAVIEGVSFGSIGGSTLDRNYLWWAIVDALGVDNVLVIAPGDNKKSFTGNGRATKAAMLNAARITWPKDIIDCDNCADALSLARIGWDRL
jgi:Holliday junction resolvasome RuvABC endonuclease subunit